MKRCLVYAVGKFWEGNPAFPRHRWVLAKVKESSYTKRLAIQTETSLTYFASEHPKDVWSVRIIVL